MATEEDIELETVRRQVDIYRQLKEAIASAARRAAPDAAAQQDMESLYEQSRSQLLAGAKRYREHGRADLASMIAQAVA